MNNATILKETFNQTDRQLAGHGRREARILKEAFQNVDEHLESDMYGKGPVIENFETKMADFLGKEAAVFFPSGTMAQQIALRIWCDEKGIPKVGYHPLSHLEIHEEDGLKELHGIDAVLLADKHRVIDLEDIQELQEEVACILLELPQREIGGQLPSFETLEQISAYCQSKGIKLHLDGARLLEVLPYYQKSAAEVCELFDSVYLSFYKGIGGIAGAILAGSQEFIEQSKVWKRRHGGDLISLYPYIIPADYYFDNRAPKMGQYFESAKELAGFFNACEAIKTVPEEPVSNMFHVHFNQPKEKMEPILAELQQTVGIGITSNLKEVNEQTCYYEVSLGDQYTELPQENLENLFRLLDKRMKEV